MSITQEDVIWGFRMILGRDPESEVAIRAHLGLPDQAALRDALLNSVEFRQHNKALEFDEKWVCTEIYGGDCRLWLDLHDKFVSFGCLIDDYEPVETGFIRDNVKPGQIVLDVGANIGWHTLGLARAVGPKGRVLAFEPRQPTNEYLARTIKENGLDQSVELHRFGLWDSEVEGGLSWAEGTTNPGGTHLEFDQSRSRQSIALKPLDMLGIQATEFIKIDVEGAELKALSGAKKLLEGSHPLILSELFPEQLQRISGCSVGDYLNFMAGYGYRCRLLERGFIGREVEDFPDYVGRELVNVVFSTDFGQVRLETE